MMNINEFLDQKHGKFIGRIYMLVVLFCANALIPIGASCASCMAGPPSL